MTATDVLAALIFIAAAYALYYKMKTGSFPKIKNPFKK
jgi:hypothetical protein